MVAPALTKERDDSGAYPQGYAIGSDDNTDLNNLRNEINAHEAASAPHSGHAPLVSPSFTGTASFETLTITNHRSIIHNVFYGDAGTEPDVGQYELTIGGVVYYVQTIDMAQNDLICFKHVVPIEYKSGQQIMLRLGYASAGSAVAYTFNSYFGLLDDGDVIDTGINTATDTSRTITSPATANEMEYVETIPVTDTTGKINSVAVEAGDVIIGKLVRTNSSASAFRLISMEMSW